NQKTIEKVTSRNTFKLGNLLHNSNILSFSMNEALDSLIKSANQHTRDVEIIIGKYEQDSTVGSKETNEELLDLFQQKCHVVEKTYYTSTPSNPSVLHESRDDS